MIRLWDFATCECGEKHNDTPIDEPRIPETIGCRCGKRIGWVRGKRNFIHATHSGRKYGEFDPQFGCIVEDYSHKKRLLKEMGATEGPPVTREQAREDLHNIEAQKKERDPNVVTADSIDEIESFIDQDMVDRKATGNRQSRQDDEGWPGGF